MLKELGDRVKALVQNGVSAVRQLFAGTAEENRVVSVPPTTRPSTSESRTSGVGNKPWERRQAYYDAGQVAVVWHLSFVKKMQGAIIVANQSYSTLYTLDDCRTEQQVWSRLLLHLGGIAAQTRFMKKFSSSQCRTDLAAARSLARDLSQISLYKTHPWGQIERRGIDLGNSFHPALSTEERRILNYAYDKACAFIEKRREVIESLADELYENGALSTERIDQLLGSRSSVHLVGATGKTFVEFD